MSNKLPAASALDKDKDAIQSSLNKQMDKFMVSSPVARVRTPGGGQRVVVEVKKGAANKSWAKSPSTKQDDGGSRKKYKNTKAAGTKVALAKETAQASVVTSTELERFSKRAQELKDDISSALEKQPQWQDSGADEPELIQLKNCILELSQLEQGIGPQVAHEQQDTRPKQLSEVAIAPKEERQNAPKLAEASRACEQVKERPMLSPKGGQNLMSSQVNKRTPNGSDGFEPLMSDLDPESKLVALKASLEKHFAASPQILEPICRKLIQMSEANSILAKEKRVEQLEKQKLLLVKDKLEHLCRELQRSNNSIRSESLDLIKMEQRKAKEHASKIQSTLAGVMKLFDENQQRNLGLKKENVELQARLKSLLEHCNDWEKSVEASLKQRDIENQLVKMELAKTNLLRNEEKEKFISEKKELLRVLSVMQEQQLKVEGQEAKLRLDLSNYASKYDECQSAISSGLSKFQLESKRTLKLLEKSKHDYVLLLSKYQASNKRIAQLMEERQHWEQASQVAKKKIDALERLCRALKQ